MPPDSDDTPDFRALFEAAPGLCVGLKPDAPRYTVIAVSDAYLAATKTTRAQLVGHTLFEVFSDDSEDAVATMRNVAASLERVRTTLAPDVLAVQKYDIPRSEADGGGYEERYWMPSNSPVLSPTGALVYILHRVEDVTELVRLGKLGAEQTRSNDALRLRAQTMEQEALQRARELEVANRLLHDANARLSALGESQFRALFDFMPQLGWTALADGAIDFYNRGWYEYTGLSFEDMQGWGWAKVHDPELLPAITERWQHSLKTGEPFEHEFPLRRHDGAFRWFLTRCNPIRDAEGAIVRWVGINTDIHDRKLAGAQTEQRLKLLIESIKDYAIFMLNPDGTVATWNAGAERIKQYRPSEIIGQHFSVFYPPEDRAKCAIELEVATRTGRVEDFGWRVRKDGSRFWANVVISAVRDEHQKLVGFSKITRDLTDGRLAEEGRLKLAREQQARLGAEAAEKRARFLAQASAVLAESLDYEVTLGNVAQLAVPQIADWCTVSARNEHGAFRRIAVVHKDPERRELAAEYREKFPPGDHRAGELAMAMKQGRAILQDVVTDANLVEAAQSPEHLRVMRGLGCSSCIMVPMRIRGEGVGVISLMLSDGARRFERDDVVLAEELAHRAAIAVDNARLYREAQHGQTVMTFLAEASAILGSSLDYETTLQTVARLVVPRFADWCAVEILEEGAIRQVAVAHVDPAKVELAHEFQKRYPPNPNAQTGTPQILRTGASELYEEIPDELLVRGARDDEHLRMIRELGLRSALSVPLVARGTTIGALSLIWAESGRRYSRDDLLVMEELGRRAGTAVDNARLYRESQAAIRLRDEFLSIAGHELKTPLAALQLQVNSLVRGAERGTLTQDLDRLKQRLLKTEAQGARLDRLITELLDVSRITASRLTLQTQELDLSQLVTEIVERFGDDFKRVGSEVKLTVAPSVMIQGDPPRLDQVFTNLISNAVKYGQGEPIEIELARNAEHVRFTVADHGIGIDPESQKRIFGRFERAVSERNFGGFGLGLWIAKEIVVGHGGTITVASKVGQGTTFTVELLANGA
ncbi:MAG: two-component hybrid histidine kinase [Myxococcales bacterium]|nr:two-component hybrid histidine kinase [Myxococcales bacterium]